MKPTVNPELGSPHWNAGVYRCWTLIYMYVEEDKTGSCRYRFIQSICSPVTPNFARPRWYILHICNEDKCRSIAIGYMTLGLMWLQPSNTSSYPREFCAFISSHSYHRYIDPHYSRLSVYKRAISCVWTTLEVHHTRVKQTWAFTGLWERSFRRYTESSNNVRTLYKPNTSEAVT